MLKRIEILDGKTGVCLYDRTWKWAQQKGKGGPALCKFILSLNLLARTLQAEDVTYVDFHPQRNETMRLSCIRNEKIIIGLFHVKNEVCMKPFMEEIKGKFEAECEALRASLQEQIDSIVDETAESMMSEEEILGEFKEFDHLLDESIHSHIPEPYIEISETEESDSRKTSEKGGKEKEEKKKEGEEEEKQEVAFLMP